ncbi:MAG: phosphatase PAP2 family protein, partial [Nitrospinae bacterium]|nr:phosphatase PAP2 family protein [Nitrospinota bacterium]
MLSSIDTALFHFINGGLKGPFLDYLMPMFLRYSDWSLIVALSLLILIYKDWRSGAYFILLLILAVALTDGITYRLIKPFFERIRPCNVIPPGTFNLMAGCSDSFSFPSQHAANMFAVAAVVANRYKKAAPYALITALMAAISRVYVGVHYPIDVA